MCNQFVLGGELQLWPFPEDTEQTWEAMLTSMQRVLGSELHMQPFP